jgi:hypothetical protein
MKRTIAGRTFIIVFLCCPPHVALGEPDGAKGQNYDRLVFESRTDAEIRVQASVMTINRHDDSASTVTVTDNGAQIYGPERETSERWKRTISVSGKGRHDIVMTCKSINSAPVYCSLSVDDAQAMIAR